MTTLSDFQFVYVGCGGTFYASSPYLAVLQRRFSVADARPIIIDPDCLEEANRSRQWPRDIKGRLKVSAAASILDVESIEIVERFQENDSLLEEFTEGQPVLAIVNVDNDECRLEVANWLARRVSTGIMVVSGCEENLGQCYPGVWMEGQPVHDWRDAHPDVGRGGFLADRCNPQNIRANALTGVLVGMCIEDIAKQVESGDWSHIKDYYWEIGDRESGPGIMWAECHSTGWTREREEVEIR